MKEKLRKAVRVLSIFERVAIGLSRYVCENFPEAEDTGAREYLRRNWQNSFHYRTKSFNDERFFDLIKAAYPQVAQSIEEGSTVARPNKGCHARQGMLAQRMS